MNEIYQRQSGFVPPASSMEFLHPLAVHEVDPAQCETSYLGFNIPELSLNCEVYHWFHPVLGVVSGGVTLWSSDCASTLEADFVDYRNFMPAPGGDIDDVTYANGVHVRVVEPLREIETDYRSPDGRVEFSFVSRAIMPAAVRLDGHHFAQAMRTEGWLRLEGAEHRIDGWFTRDRSWSSLRPETAQPIPALSWIAAVFGDDLAVHLVAHDSPSEQISGQDAADDGGPRAPHWGYVWRDGQLRAVTGLEKTTRRGPDGLVPIGTELVVTDSAGDRLALAGQACSRLPLSVWPNMLTHFVQMQYECDGRTGYGDFQDIHFIDYVRGVRRTREIRAG